MHRPVLPLLLAVALGAACSGPAAAPAGPRPPPVPDLPLPADAQDAVVVAVSDGDTMRLRGRGTGPVPGTPTRVRLLLIDTPEVFGAVQCYGPEASARTKELLPEGTPVRVQGDVEARDRYGRPLVHLWTSDGVNVGEELVREGFARVLQIDPNRRYLEVFRRQEAQARQAGRGLWGACR